MLLAAGTAEAMLPMMMLSQLNEKAKISVARIQDILELPLQAVPPADAALSPKDASVAFEAVRFGYAPVQNALQNVSFKAAAGEVTALVGASGAGKSTIANLITRSWEVDGGKVLIGGVDVRDLTTDQLTQQVATVFQHSFLFSLSLRENICLGIETVSEADLIAAAKAAQIFDFICTLPHGFDTQAGERGLFLSGGQRQRITIARAILQDRPILILDEATAHSDPQNEVQIFAALSHLTKGRTVIVITHRLRTIQAADKIVVLDQGKVVETGHHAALLKRAGTYARLWQAQQIADQWQVKSKGAADA